MENNTPPTITVDGEKTAVQLIRRDTRVKEHCMKQLKLYSPCSCGSGKKFKFCCNGKQMLVINTGE